MKIEAAEPVDIHEIMRLVQSAIVEMLRLGIDQWDEIYPDENTFLNDIHSGHLFKVILEQRIAGIIVLNTQQENAYRQVPWSIHCQRTLVIHRLCVHPEFQGKGIAKKLVRFAEEHAREKGYDCIRLDAYSRNPAALSLYEKLGYLKAGAVFFRKGQFFCYEKGLITGSR